MEGKRTIAWYAVMTAPSAEARAAAELRRLGYQIFYPFDRLRRYRKRSGKDTRFVVTIERPYFSRYLFVAVMPDQSLYPINEANHVSTVITLGGEPLVIPDDIMDEIMGRAQDRTVGLMSSKDETAPAKRGDRFEPGQKVIIKDNNPLQGLIAEIIVDNGKKIMAWIEGLGVAHKIELPPEAVAEIA